MHARHTPILNLVAGVLALVAASCLPEGDKYACVTDADCVTGFTCSAGVCVAGGAVDPCEGFSCGTHGTCAAVNGTATCTCETGWDGTCTTCAAGYQDNDANDSCTPDCASANLACGTYGSCDDTSGTAGCVCKEGHTGDGCTTCLSGYQDNNSDGTCEKTCSTAALSCGDYGLCNDATGTAKCDCETGYTGEACGSCDTGFQDNNADGTCDPTCATSGLSCGEHGTCSDATGRAACTCEIGYAGRTCGACSPGFKDDFGVCKGVTRFLGSNTSNEQFGGMVFQPDGSMFLGLGFGGTTALASPPVTDVSTSGDSIIVALDPAGQTRWTTRIGGQNREGLTNITADAQGRTYISYWLYSSGTFDVGGMAVDGISGGLGLFALDENGAYRWQRSYGNGEFHAVAVDTTGNVYAVGFVNGPTDFGGGPVNHVGRGDQVIVAFDADGNYRWARALGGPANDSIEAVTTDAAGNVYVLGQSDGTVNLGQSTGSYTNTTGANGATIASYTSAGQHRWSKYFTPLDTARPGYSAAQVLKTDSTGNVYAGIVYSGDRDFGGGTVTTPVDSNQVAFALVKFGSDGTFLAQRILNTGIPVNAGSIHVDAKDNVIIAGNVNNGGGDLGEGVPVAPNHSAGAYWAHYKPDLTPIHTQFSRSGAYPWAEGAFVRTDGVVVVVGHHNGSVDFGSGNATTPGGMHPYIAFLPPVPPPL